MMEGENFAVPVIGFGDEIQQNLNHVAEEFAGVLVTLLEVLANWEDGWKKVVPNFS